MVSLDSAFTNEKFDNVMCLYIALSWLVTIMEMDMMIFLFGLVLSILFYPMMNWMIGELE